LTTDRRPSRSSKDGQIPSTARSSLDAAHLIAIRPVPLVIYVFTDSEETKDKCASVLELRVLEIV
jgi:hypothetical protein